MFNNEFLERSLEKISSKRTIIQLLSGQTTLYPTKCEADVCKGVAEYNVLFITF